MFFLSRKSLDNYEILLLLIFHHLGVYSELKKWSFGLLSLSASRVRVRVRVHIYGISGLRVTFKAFSAEGSLLWYVRLRVALIIFWAKGHIYTG